MNSYTSYILNEDDGWVQDIIQNSDPEDYGGIDDCWDIDSLQRLCDEQIKFERDHGDENDSERVAARDVFIAQGLTIQYDLIFASLKNEKILKENGSYNY
jgi:hypothetical protein